MCSPGHSLRSLSLHNLANAMQIRFKQLDDLDSLAEAVELHRRALDMRPAGHPGRLTSLLLLADALHARFRKFSDIDNGVTVRFFDLPGVSDLEVELNLLREGLHSCTDRHPMRMRFLFAIGRCRLRTGTHIFDFEDGIRHTLEALQSRCLPARSCLRYGIHILRAIEAAYKHSREDTSAPELGRHQHDVVVLQIYIQVIRLLPRAASFGLDHAGRLRELTRAETISRDAATRAIRAERNTEALEILEEGRDVFWVQALRLRATDLDPLPAQDAEMLRMMF
jgi:hypothetical protein